MAVAFSTCTLLSTCRSPRTAAGKTWSYVLSSTPSFPILGSLSASSGSNFRGSKVVLHREDKGKPTIGDLRSVHAQTSLCARKTVKWWEKCLLPNMEEIHSAQHLVDSLLSAGNKLVIVDFFSPRCGGCKALHPKICQLAEFNPDARFLQINYEEHKSMCYSLNVPVLPFFRFYGGAQGRLCSFSCTNATIKKFKDAMAKHSTERCSLGPARGLEEKELMALVGNKDLCFTNTKLTAPILAPFEDTEAFPRVTNRRLFFCGWEVEDIE